VKKGHSKSFYKLHPLTLQPWLWNSPAKVNGLSAQVEKIKKVYFIPIIEVSRGGALYGREGQAPQNFDCLFIYIYILVKRDIEF